MDIESIAGEIVAIRNRLEEIQRQPEELEGSALKEEKAGLLARLRHLQNLLSAADSGDQDDPAKPGTVQYLPPA